MDTNIIQEGVRPAVLDTRPLYPEDSMAQLKSSSLASNGIHAPLPLKSSVLSAQSLILHMQIRLLRMPAARLRSALFVSPILNADCWMKLDIESTLRPRLRRMSFLQLATLGTIRPE